VAIASTAPVRFTPEDVERILKSLFPSGGPDPFGKIESLILDVNEDIEKGKTVDDLRHEQTQDDLADIKSRTFGILLLQIFKTLSFFMRLLPQAKVILIVIAAIGLLNSLLEDGEVSVDSIKAAVKATGLQKFIDEILAELNALVAEIADHASELADVTSQVFVSIAGGLEGVEGRLESAIGHLQGRIGGGLDLTPEDALAGLNDALFDLQGMLPGLTESTNAASNSDLFIGPALRNLDDRMREIPTLALKLVRLA